MPQAAAMAGVGLLGALASSSDARRARKENARGTRENLTETSTPWGPSIDYRTGLMDDAFNLGQQGPMPWNVRGRNFGPSGEIQQRGDELWDRAQAGSDLERQAGGFTSALLAGRDPNPYRAAAFDAAQGYRGPNELFQMLNQELGGFGADRWSAYNDPYLGNTQQPSGSGVPSLGGAAQPQMPQPPQLSEAATTGGRFGTGDAFQRAIEMGNQDEIQQRMADIQAKADQGVAWAPRRLEQMQQMLQQAQQPAPPGQQPAPPGQQQGAPQGRQPAASRVFYGSPTGGQVWKQPGSLQQKQRGQQGQAPGAGAFGQAGFSGEIGGILRDLATGQGGPYAEQIQGFIDQAGQNPFIDQTNQAIAALGNNQYQGTIDEILGGKFLSGNPQADAMIEMEQRRLRDQFNSQVLPGLDQAAEAYGRFRGGEAAKAQAMGGLATALGDIGTQFRFQDYNARMGDLMNTLGMGLQSRASDQAQLANLIGQGGQMYDTSMGRAQQALAMGIGQQMDALGLGSQRDLAHMQDLTQRYGIDTSAATSRANAASAASAAAANAAANRQFQGEQAARDRALQQRLQEQGMLMDLVGGIGNAEQFGMGMMGDIGANFGQSQADALGMAGQLGNADFSRMLDAFGANFGVDQMRQQGAQDAYQQDLDRFRYQSQAGWQDLLNQANIINAMSGGYGTNTRQGVTHTPYTGPSTLGGGISGGLGALGLFGGLGGLFGGPGG